MFAVLRQCGRCNQMVDFPFQVAFEHTQRSPEDVVAAATTTMFGSGHSLVIDKYEGRKGRALGSAVAHCPRCKGPSFFVFEAQAEHIEAIIESATFDSAPLMGGPDLVTILEAHPAPKQPHSDPAWPEETLALFRDAQRMLDQGMSSVLIVTACRSVLEIALKRIEQQESKEFLAKRIKRLRSEGVITQPIADWADQIRVDGNFAVHDGQGDEANAREYVAFLRLFLDMTFALPERIKSLQSTQS